MLLVCAVWRRQRAEWQTLCRAKEFHPPLVKTTAFSLELSHYDTWSDPREPYLFWYGLHFFPLSNELRKHRAWRWDVEMCGRELRAPSHCKPESNGVGCKVSKDRSASLVLSSSHPFISWPYNLSLCWSHVFSPLSQRDSQTWEDWMKWETESSGVRGSMGGCLESTLKHLMAERRQ